MEKNDLPRKNLLLTIFIMLCFYCFIFLVWNFSNEDTKHQPSHIIADLDVETYNPNKDILDDSLRNRNK